MDSLKCPDSMTPSWEGSMELLKSPKSMTPSWINELKLINLFQGFPHEHGLQWKVIGVLHVVLVVPSMLSGHSLAVCRPYTALRRRQGLCHCCVLLSAANVTTAAAVMVVVQARSHFLPAPTCT